MVSGAASNLERIAITDRLFSDTSNGRIKSALVISDEIFVFVDRQLARAVLVNDFHRTLPMHFET